MGDYESPQGMGASREASAPMVAVLADQGLPAGTGQRAPGIGPDGRVVLVQTKLPLRHGDRLTYRRWDADFNNCASKGQLNGLLANRAVPTVEAVQLSFKGQSPEQQLQTYNASLQRYQQENTALFFMIYGSIDMRGDWELNDLTTVEESFQQGDLRDGLGLLKWVQSFYDLTSDSGQIKAREAYSKFKFTIDMGVGQLQKTLLDSLSGWSVIGDNDKSSKIKLYDFYKQTRDKFPKQPDSHPIVRVRQMLADLIFNEAQILANVNLTIERIIEYARAVGVPEGPKQLVNVLTRADNNCKTCDTFGCKAGGDKAKCYMFNTVDPTTCLPSGPAGYVLGGRKHLEENPTLESLKGVRFAPIRTEGVPGGKGGGGKGKGRGGGRGYNGRGGGRQATPIIGGGGMTVVEMLDEDGTNAGNFEDWLQTVQQSQVTPVFGNVGKNISAVLFGEQADDEESDEVSENLVQTQEALAATQRQLLLQQRQIDAMTPAATPASVRPASVNPALNPTTPRVCNGVLTSTPSVAAGKDPLSLTPIINTPLDLLRAGGNLNTNSGGVGPQSAIASTPSSTRASGRDKSDEKTVTEQLMLAGAQHEKEKRLQRQKETKKGLLKSLLSMLLGNVQLLNRAIYRVLNRLGDLSAFQAIAIVAGARLLYPYLLPELRRLLRMVEFKLLHVRDMFLNKIATKLVGAAVGMTAVGANVGLVAGLTRLGETDDADGNSNGNGGNSPPPVIPAAVVSEPTSQEKDAVEEHTKQMLETDSKLEAVAEGIESPEKKQLDYFKARVEQLNKRVDTLRKYYLLCADIFDGKGDAPEKDLSEARENVEASEKALLETTQELEMANKEYAAMLDKTPIAKVVYDLYQESVSGELHKVLLTNVMHSSKKAVEAPTYVKELQGLALVVANYNEGAVGEAKVLLELNCQVDYTTIGVLGRQQLITILDELHESFQAKCNHYLERYKKISSDIDRQIASRPDAEHLQPLNIYAQADAAKINAADCAKCLQDLEGLYREIVHFHQTGKPIDDMLTLACDRSQCDGPAFGKSTCNCPTEGNRSLDVAIARARAKKEKEERKDDGHFYCPTHSNIVGIPCANDCGRIWCMACVHDAGLTHDDVCSEVCSVIDTYPDGDMLKWAPGLLVHAIEQYDAGDEKAETTEPEEHEDSLDVGELGSKSIVAPAVKRVSERVLNVGRVIPDSACMHDDGATIGCMLKTLGALKGTYVADEDDSIGVGDSNSTLQSHGSYVYVLQHTGANGETAVLARRYAYTPKVICNIHPEPVEIYTYDNEYTFNKRTDRTLHLKNGPSLRLHMTDNGLGWTKIQPVHDSALVRAAIEEAEMHVVMAIDREHRYLNIVDVTPKEGVTPVSKEEVAKEMAKGTSIDKMTISTDQYDLINSTDIEKMALSSDMHNLIDPVFNVVNAHTTLLAVKPSTDVHTDGTYVLPLTEAKTTFVNHSIGFKRPAKLNGVELLMRLHVALGHPSLEVLLATLAKTENMRKGIVTKDDVEKFVRCGCVMCDMWLMKRPAVPRLPDRSKAPAGKKWTFDTLKMPKRSPNGNLYITRFIDDGSSKKKSWMHPDFTSDSILLLVGKHRAWARPVHGEIWIQRMDNHPSQKSKEAREYYAEAQHVAEFSPPYHHNSIIVEQSWQNDVPRTMILLASGPGKDDTKHFEVAFLCHERCENRLVKSRIHGNELSADMVYYGNTFSGINVLLIFWAPLLWLQHPEVRDSKFEEHAMPGAYCGPSQENESDRAALIWNGNRYVTIDIGCARIDERQVIAMSSRTNAKVQPFAIRPDPKVELPCFDQWYDPATERPGSVNSATDAVLDVLPPDLMLGDPDPTSPFFVLLYAGKRKLNEVGHFVRRMTKKTSCDVVSIDTKRCGYNHNTLLPRVRAWVIHLVSLVLCIGLLSMQDCGPFAPMRFNQNPPGPPVLFSLKHVDGVPDPTPAMQTIIDITKKHAELVLEASAIVHEKDGKVLIEQPVGHGKGSHFPITDREEHSTFYDTSWFKSYMAKYGGDFVYSDQCMAGADTRKTTQWYGNSHALGGLTKHLGGLMCNHEGGHDKSLVGKNEHGEYRSRGSEEYPPMLCKLISLVLLEPCESWCGQQFVANFTADAAVESVTDGEPEVEQQSMPNVVTRQDTRGVAEVQATDQAFSKMLTEIDAGMHRSGTATVETDAPIASPGGVGPLSNFGATTEAVSDIEPVVELAIEPDKPKAPPPPDPYAVGEQVQVWWEEPQDSDRVSKYYDAQVLDSFVRNRRRHYELEYSAIPDDDQWLEPSRFTHRLDDITVRSKLPAGENVTLTEQPDAESDPDDRPLNMSVDSFVNHGVKVVALPDDPPPDEPSENSETQHATAAGDSSWLDGLEGYVPYDPTGRDIGASDVVAATLLCTKEQMGQHYSECMAKMESALKADTDVVGILHSGIDIEEATAYTRLVLAAVVGGDEIIVEPDDSRHWHTPKNQREYLRSPQRALWRTAKELKMDQYQKLGVYKLVAAKGIDPKMIMGSLWAFKIKYDEKGVFEKLNPRWCVKGTRMDKSIYCGFSEVAKIQYIKVLGCIRATYKVIDFIIDTSNAFQATRTDDGSLKTEKLYCDQAPGFEERGNGREHPKGARLVCEILVALQGRIDASRLFGQRLEQLLRAIGGRRSTWDPKVWFFHNGPLKDTDANLEHVLEACDVALVEQAPKLKQGEPPPGWAMMAVHVDDCPGVASSQKMVDFIIGGIQVQYECTFGRWKKVLGFRFDVNDKKGTVTMSCETVIEEMAEKFLPGQLRYDAKLPMRDVELEAGEVPPVGHPERDAYLSMQSETRSILGLLLWVSIAYPQIIMATNKGCGFMSNPSYGVNAFAKHIVLNLVQNPTPVTWGGNPKIENLILSSPTVPPFTDGAKEYGLHYASDASPSDTAKGITGGVGMLAGGAVDTISQRQHLASPDVHACELSAAGTVMHRIVPMRGILQEARIPQVAPTPCWMDSASTIFVAENRAAPKKSAWTRRKAEVLTEAYENGEVAPEKCEDPENFADPQTKYLTYKPWARHLHYTHNFEGDPPPRAEKKKKIAAVLTPKMPWGLTLD